MTSGHRARGSRRHPITAASAQQCAQYPRGQLRIGRLAGERRGVRVGLEQPHDGEGEFIIVQLDREVPGGPIAAMEFKLPEGLKTGIDGITGVADVDEGRALDDPAGVDYRSMVVEVSVPLRAKTPLVWAAGAGRGQPFHVNAALVSPYVINVFPRSFTAR